MSLPRTTLGDYERGHTEPNIATLIKLSDYFDVDLDALLKQDLSHDDLEIIRNKNLRILAISVDNEKEGNIELVDTKAEAGYLTHFQDPEFIRDLPKIAFPNIPQGTFRGFEIRGDSMLPIEPGSIIICSYVENLNDIKDDRTYIIVSKDEGLVYKRVRNLTEKQELYLKSDNESYLPYTMPYGEVSEIWQYYAHVSFSDSMSTYSYLWEEKISDLQRKVTEIHQQILPQ